MLADYDFSEVIDRTTIKLLKKYQGKYPLKAIRETKIIKALISEEGFAYNQAKIAFQNLEPETRWRNNQWAHSKKS